MTVAPERQLCDELLTTWLAHGVYSPEFQSQLAQAVHEFDTVVIIESLVAISTALMQFAADNLDGDLRLVQSIITDSYPKETRHA